MDRTAEMLAEARAGRVLDVRREGQEVAEGVFLLRRFVPDRRYADLARGRWIGSVGESLADGRILAAVDSRFADGPNFSTLFCST